MLTQRGGLSNYSLLTQMGLKNVKVIGIHFTKFSEMATVEAIREELTLLDTLRK